MDGRPSWRSTFIMLGVSLALHVALFAWLLAGSASPLSPPGQPPIELMIVEVRPPRTRSPPAPASPSQPMPRKRRAAAAPGIPPAAVAAPTPDESPAEVLQGDMPRLDTVPGIPVGAPSVGKPDDLDLLSRMPVISTPEQGLHAPPRPKDGKELIAAIASQAVGLHRVSGGNVPGYFSDLKKVLLAAWDVARLEDRRRKQGRGVHTTRTLILLVQDRTGNLLQAELLDASGDRELGEAALLDLQRIGKELPKPTPDALGTRERLASTWEFEYQPLSEKPWKAEFDLVQLVDKRAIPPPTSKKITLLSIE